MKGMDVEKTFQLDQHEVQYSAMLEQELQESLARVATLMLELEAAKTNLQMSQERNRSFVRTIVVHRGLDQVQAARITRGNLVCSLPDVSPETIPQRVNGVETGTAGWHHTV